MGENTYKFTVCIPVRNTIAYLRQCLDSVINQTFDDYEIVIVDNDSTDGSAELLDDYASKYGFIRVIHQTNQGLLLSRRRAIEAAKGDYLCFLDSDDYWELNFLETVNSIIEETSCDIVSISCRLSTKSGMKTQVLYDQEGIITREEYIKVVLKNPILNNLWLKIIKKELFNSKNTKLYESWEPLVRMEGSIQTIEVLENTFIVSVTNKPLYIYRVLGQGLMAKGALDFYKELIIDNFYFNESSIAQNLLFKDAVKARQANTLFNIFFIIRNILSSEYTFKQKKKEIYDIVEGELFLDLYNGECSRMLKFTRRCFLKLAYKKWYGLIYFLNKIL